MLPTKTLDITSRASAGKCSGVRIYAHLMPEGFVYFNRDPRPHKTSDGNEAYGKAFAAILINRPHTMWGNPSETMADISRVIFDDDDLMLWLYARARETHPNRALLDNNTGERISA